MALILADRVQETTSSTGTGTLILSGAVSGFQSFSAVGDGNTTYYTIVSGTDWEVGIGTYTSSGFTLSRDTVYDSSAAGSKISVVSGATVFCDYPSDRALHLGNTSLIASLGTITSGVWNGSVIGASYIATLNQNTTGSAATLTTPRAIYGNNFDGSAGLTNVIASTYGGTGNGFAKLAGPAGSEKTFTLPNASANILTDNAAVTILQGGTGQTSKTAAFDALSPATTKGDLIAYNGTDNVRLGVGSDNLYLAADSTSATGLAWKSVLTPSVVYTASSLSLTNGVYVSGSVTDTQVLNDGNAYQITDGTTTGPAWIITGTFTGVTSFNRVVSNIDYTAASGHTIYFQLYNNNTTTWDNIGSYSGASGYSQYALEVLGYASYISSGTVQARLYHSNTGNAAHATKLDYFALEQSNQGSQGPRGATGATGTTGAGVPVGGTTGQYLVKLSGTDYATTWSDLPTVSILQGGTGQTSKTAAFDALSPATTKGDLIAYNGTDNIRLAVGTDNYVLTADSTSASGVKWAAASGGGLSSIGTVVTTSMGWNLT